jgi:two-component system, NtrC family, sensor histidine kinase KinB
MNIQRQIVAGLIFLFGVAVIVTGMATYYTGKQAKESEAILKDNYNSVVYTKDMLKDLSYTNDANVIDFDLFEKSLKLQQNNITEKGEKEFTDALTSEFNKLKTEPHSTIFVASMRDYLYKIMEVNLKAIEEKSGVAINTAQTFFTYFIVTGVLFLILFLFILFKLPKSEPKD